ncbi:MAG: hypothetical protein V3U93_11170, partial [Alphaproteobacteria bacterium]
DDLLRSVREFFGDRLEKAVVKQPVKVQKKTVKHKKIVLRGGRNGNIVRRAGNNNLSGRGGRNIILGNSSSVVVGSATKRTVSRITSTRGRGVPALAKRFSFGRDSIFGGRGSNTLIGQRGINLIRGGKGINVIKRAGKNRPTGGTGKLIKAKTSANTSLKIRQFISDSTSRR